ncbi:MAG TPA: hypothetical protein DIW82_01300 [Corynebacterium nuruki]|jgi:hypothetical protein|uniref:Uncharacterized protein n=1 Tax=Corynebacterium nuruki TaxID=1032851 RepID=A0A3D4SVZ4_9CORY|nr:hypothetical protein [Corynebacterium nuruki]HCT13453.1 hypothetical protein [Corynebacterium nuruki]
MDIPLGQTGRTLHLPDDWEILNTLPEDAPGTVAVGYQLAGSNAVVTIAPLTSQMMPVDRDEVVAGIRPSLREFHAGLVEADAGETPAGDVIVYTIVKTLPPDEGDGSGTGAGMQYNLTLHLAVDNGEYLEPWQIQGFFTETGVTGLRDAAVMDLKRREGAIEITDGGLVGWFVDPYDPSLTPADGYLLANLSEDREYDARFAEHPLSQARGLVTAVIGID